MADTALTLDVARFNARLAAFVQRVGADVDRVVYKVATDVLRDTVQGWPVDTGHSRAAWWGPRRIGPSAFQIGNPTRYARVLEWGLYRGVGPRTVRVSGTRFPGGFQVTPGIYSKQKPAAPLRRALAKNYGEMTKQLQANMRQDWGR